MLGLAKNEKIHEKSLCSDESNIVKTERVGMLLQTKFPTWEQNVPNVGIKRSQRGNAEKVAYLYQL